MFVGHFAVGFGSKRVAPEASLGTLLAAPLFLDLLWPIFLLLGLESVKIVPGDTAFTPLDLHDYPYSHSLLMAVVWSLLFGGIHFAVKRNWRVAWVLAAGVFSHWVLDFVTHRPDMPLYPGSTTYVGLGLWNSVAGTMIVELGMFAAGVWIYATTTRAINRTGAVTFWALVVFLFVMYFATAFGPPPPSAEALKMMGPVTWIFIPWGWWIDRNRTPVVREAAPGGS